MDADSSQSEVEALIPLVYAELRAIAGALVRGAGHPSLQPTELVHEAWVRLQRGGPWESRAHFGAVAAKAMRQILIDRARRRNAEKRGGGWVATTVSGLAHSDPPVDLLDLEAALRELQEVDPRGAQIVELRYFGGLSVTETAEWLGMSRSAVHASWRLSRAWLEARLREG